MKKALIVEDDPQWSELLCAMLKLKGWSCRLEATLAGAVEALRHDSAGLVLLDLKLPDSSIENTLEKIGELRRAGGQSLVVVTGVHVTSALKRCAFFYGADHVMSKDATGFDAELDRALARVAEVASRT